VYFTFVMERRVFAIAATLRNIRLSVLKPLPAVPKYPCR